MNVKKFESKYGSKGGLKKLTELRSLFYSINYISKHFGVSNEAVRKWMKNFFGISYDPRTDREQAIVNNMVEFARANSYKDFKSAFRGRSPYYQQALDQCYSQGIYETTIYN